MTDKEKDRYVLPAVDGVDRYWYLIDRQDNKKYPFVARLHTFADGEFFCLDRTGVNLQSLPDGATRR